MILKNEDFDTIKKDIDLDKISNLLQYYGIVKSISESPHKHQIRMRDDATKIKDIIESEYPEYFL